MQYLVCGGTNSGRLTTSPAIGLPFLAPALYRFSKQKYKIEKYKCKTQTTITKNSRFTASLTIGLLFQALVLCRLSSPTEKGKQITTRPNWAR